MSDSNICKFLPNNNKSEDINIINFVYETQSDKLNNSRCESVYKLHLVTKGQGLLCKADKSYRLNIGDIFFTFPADRYTIDSGENFEYIYISYIGVKANEIMEKLDIRKNNFLFGGFDELVPIWRDSISDDKSVLKLRCEGILLYAFSLLGKQNMQKQEPKFADRTIVEIKKYIEEGFCDKSFSLDSISKKFSYNKKYISGMFKKNFKVGISQYITTLRMQKAHTLIEEGCTSVKDISDKCGYGDALYFSRVFKNAYGESPTKYIKSLDSKGNKQS